MARVAFLFPGQGAQVPGMGRDLVAEFPEARDTFSEADEALGESLSRLCFAGTSEELTRTANAQPAILCTSIAIARVLEARAGLRPAVVAGHSLGEWSALVAVGVLHFAEALRAVRERGQRMQAAVPQGQGAMSALVGGDIAVVEALCQEASHPAGGQPEVSAGIVVPANLNGGGQVVVAGHVAAVCRLEELAATSGTRIRATRLAVSAPFHSPLMAPARDALIPTVTALAVAAPRAPVVSNVDALAHDDATGLRERLLAQVTAPVRWEECVRQVIGLSDRAVEVGPGRVLTGLARRIDKSYACVPTADVAGLRAIIEEAANWRS